MWAFTGEDAGCEILRTPIYAFQLSHISIDNKSKEACRTGYIMCERREGRDTNINFLATRAR